MGAMSMTRKVLRFGPSIVTIKTVINNQTPLPSFYGTNVYAIIIKFHYI